LHHFNAEGVPNYQKINILLFLQSIMAGDVSIEFRSHRCGLGVLTQNIGANSPIGANHPTKKAAGVFAG